MAPLMTPSAMRDRMAPSRLSVRCSVSIAIEPRVMRTTPLPARGRG
jgi:hypothetical protein